MPRVSIVSVVAAVLAVVALVPTLHQGAASLDSGLSLSPSRGIVNSTFVVRLVGRPPGDKIDIRWDGLSLATVVIDQVTGSASTTVRVPASVKGMHTVSAWRGSTLIHSASFEVVPRIKITPSMAGWGDTVDVSLRGYAPRTVVRIRWYDGSSWIEVDRVATSGTGSANLWVDVPRWAPVGPNSIRGDAVLPDGGRAQTNAFRADRLICACDPVESLRTTATPPNSPTPTIPETATPEPSSTPTSTPTAQPPVSGSPVAEAGL